MPTYKVIVTGKILAGFSEQQVRQQLTELFQLHNKPEQLEKLFQHQAVTIKRKLDKKSATEYQQAIVAAGMDCQIEQEAPETPAAFNPYQQPTANLEQRAHEQNHTTRVLRDTPTSLDAIHGKIWYSEAYALFKQQPGSLIIMTVIFLLACFGFGAVMGILDFILPGLSLPFNIAFNLILPVVTASFMLICQQVELQQNINARMLLLAFQQKQLRNRLFAMVGLLFLTLLLAGGLAFLPIFALGTNPLLLLIAPLMFLLVFLPLIMAIWFVPALLAFHDLELKQALLLSLQGCWYNKMAFLIYGLIAIPLAFIATIPLGLGWLVLLPISYATIYISYQQIFTEEA